MRDLELYRERLTKEFLYSLKEDLYFSSNCYITSSRGGRHTIFNETVSSLEDRKEQWDRIKNARAGYRLGHVYKNEF